MEEDQINEGVNEAVATVREADSKKSARGGVRHRNIIDCKIFIYFEDTFLLMLNLKERWKSHELQMNTTAIQINYTKQR